MISPWQYIDKAFEPMYDAKIIVEYTRGQQTFRSTMTACIMTDNTDDPESDDFIDSEVQ